MRIRIRTDELRRAARKALAGAGKRKEAYMDILGKHQEYAQRPVLITALEDGRIKISGWDLDAEVTASAPAEVEELGLIQVDGADLLGIAQRVQTEVLEMHSESKREYLVITAGRNVWKMKAIEEELPGRHAAPPKTKTWADVKGDVFHRACRLAGGWYDRGRYWAIGGVLVEVDPAGVVSIVSTDRYRLAWASAAVAAGPGGAKEGKVVIPGRKFALARLLEGDKVSLEWGDGLYASDSAGTEIWWRGMGYEYPDYAQVIPKEVDWTVLSVPGLLHRIISRALVLGKCERDRTPTVRLAGKADELTISASGWVGDMCEVEKGVLVEGEGRAALNTRYLLDLLALLKDSGGIRLEFTRRALLVRELTEELALVWLIVGKQEEVVEEERKTA